MRALLSARCRNESECRAEGILPRILAGKHPVVLLVWCAVTFLILPARTSSVAATPVATGSIKVTVSASTSGAGAPAAPLSGARLTLVNRDLPGQMVKAVTDPAGNFAFTGLPAATYLLTAEADGLPSVTREIRLTAGATLSVEIVLTASLSESVTVRDEEGLLSTSETSTSNIVRERALQNLPLRPENFQGALPLTPGVVRDSDGQDHIKGARRTERLHGRRGGCCRPRRRQPGLRYSH